MNKNKKDVLDIIQKKIGTESIIEYLKTFDKALEQENVKKTNEKGESNG